jgi:5-hydroxyisourate hydrolase-like protein (transthyretin family)
MITPLPLGGTYVVEASRDKNFTFSDPIVINEAHPLQKTELHLRPGKSAKVLVLDPAGAPAAGIPVSFSRRSAHGGTTYGPDPLTDVEGRVTFRDLNPDPKIEYFVRVPSRQHYQATAPLPVKPGESSPAIIRLAPGLTLHGRLTDSKTDRPLPDAEVTATRMDGSYTRYEAESNTDAEGRFHFSNLADGRYTLTSVVRDARRISHSPSPTVTAGQSEPVELLATVHEWSNPR